MAKITLDNTLSGYRSNTTVNANNDKIEDALNNKVLYRDNPTGEPNQMESNLDMNSNSILNVSTDLTDSGSLLSLGDADTRYGNVTGDTMTGALIVRDPVGSTEAARKDGLENEASARQAADAIIITNYQSGDNSLQAQISGSSALLASAFSEISWHGQTITNSVTIPANKNAWSFGPSISIATGHVVTIESGAFWTIADINLSALVSRAVLDANTADIDAQLATVTADITTNSTNISANTADIATNTTDIASKPDYITEVVSLTGEFTAGEQMRCTKIGNVVTLTALNQLSHASDSNVISGFDIPAAYRPTEIMSTMYHCVGAVRVEQLGVLTDGRIQITYFDWAGAPYSTTVTNRTPSITYSVA